jgi:hypothetical protein
MSASAITPVLQGCVAALAFVACLFFLSFWRSTQDRFFVFFAASFGIEAVNRLHMGFNAQSGEDGPINYCIRLLTYALILVAIWEKNRPKR